MTKYRITSRESGGYYIEKQKSFLGVKYWSFIKLCSYISDAENYLERLKNGEDMDKVVIKEYEF